MKPFFQLFWEDTNYSRTKSPKSRKPPRKIRRRNQFRSPATGDKDGAAEGSSLHHHKNQALWGEGTYNHSTGKKSSRSAYCTTLHGCGRSVTAAQGRVGRLDLGAAAGFEGERRGSPPLLPGAARGSLRSAMGFDAKRAQTTPRPSQEASHLSIASMRNCCCQQSKPPQVWGCRVTHKPF